jgi:tetraacyldisaccharide 4'-kinase
VRPDAGTDAGSDPSFDRFGDEAILLARRCPNVRVIVACDRAAGSELAGRLGANWIVLDDGLQQRALQPSHSVVVLAAESPLGNGRMLPLGPLRDPLSSLEPRDAIWLHGEGSASAGIQPVFRSRTIPVGSVPATDLAAPPRSVNGMKVAAFAGIARPERFLRSLRDAGATLAAHWLRGDHRVFRLDELVQSARLAQSLGAEALICTEKDAVRLPREVGSLPLPVLALQVGLELSLGGSEIPTLLSG